MTIKISFTLTEKGLIIEDHNNILIDNDARYMIEQFLHILHLLVNETCEHEEKL